MNIIGIDPGSKGGMACFQADAIGPEVFKFDGATETDICDRLREWSAVDCFAYVELVGSMPGEGHAGAFAFGNNFGCLRGMLIALGIPREFPTAGKWCKTFGLVRSKTESKTQWKNRHKSKAQELWPSIKITHAIADALLIAEYGRRLKFLAVQSPAGDASRCG